ncbi:MAG TPA: hypothetical protein ENK96_09710 [Desulfobulbaceae bacterium]|nr:hypothetical protein [Desulfobulbaceae bacterium]
MNALQQEAMLRKPILMPRGMVEKVNKIAGRKKVSFAKVVREAVDAFDEGMSGHDAALLDALAEAMLESTRELVGKIENIAKRLDETHAMLEKH